MRVPFTNLAQFGVIKDKHDYDLPPTAFTDAKNVRFQDGKLKRFLGHLETLVGAPQAAYWAMHCFDNTGNSHWLIAGLTDAWDFSSGAYTEITRVAGDYAATAKKLWTGGVLGNIPVINNGVDKPQMWSPVAAATKLVDLTNWPATHVAQVVKPFKNFLFALNITEGATSFQHRVRISHPAAPGAVPSSWDDTDATKDVFSLDLSDFGAGRLVDCIPMRDINVLYKERSTWGAQFIGGKNKWRLFPIFEEVGMFEQNCGTSFAENSMHFVMTGDDLLVHNGQTPRWLLPKRLRRWLQANIDTTNYDRSFCVHNISERECWACFPLVGSTWPNIALVWNYDDDTLTLRELDNYSFIAPGQIPLIVTGDVWDNDDQVWDADTSRWDELTHPPFIRRLLALKPDVSKLFHLDLTDQFDGADFTASVERTGLDVIGFKGGEYIRSREHRRIIQRVFIQAHGGPIDVQIGTTGAFGDGIAWSVPQTFDPETQEYLDFGLHTQLWGIRFSSTGSSEWHIISFEVEIEPVGELG